MRNLPTHFGEEPFKSMLTSGAMTNSSLMVYPFVYNTFPLVGNNWTGVGSKTQFGLYVYSGTPSKPLSVLVLG